MSVVKLPPAIVGTKITFLLACYTIAVAIAIEALNSFAGGILPRESKGKWRIAAESMVQLSAERLNGDIEAKRMTEPEAVTQRQNERTLRSVTSGFGLAQYVVAPLVVILAAWSLGVGPRAWNDWILNGFSLAAGSTALWLAWYRHYWASLGW